MANKLMERLGLVTFLERNRCKRWKLLTGNYRLEIKIFGSLFCSIKFYFCGKLKED